MAAGTEMQGIDDIFRVINLMQLPVFIIEVIDDNLVFRKLNKYYETEVGIRSSDVEGKTAQEFLPPRVADTIEGNYWNCILLEEGYEYEEVLSLNGVEKWWSTTLSPVFDDDNRIRYVIGTAKDITDIKTANLYLTKENAIVRRQNDDINTLTAIAAHDLRPAIHNVKIFAEMLMDGFQDMGDGKLRKIQTIHSISGILSEYVERVLTHARSINISKSEAEIFPVEHIIKDIIAVADPESTLDITYPSGFVNAEEIVFQIILRNLVDNATRFATSRIAIAIEKSAEHPGTLVLSISDDGKGFPGGSEGFDKWVQNDGDRHLKTSGFGLHAVKQLAETRGGRFWLDTPRLGGTTLCLSLPGSLVEEEQVAEAA